MRREGSFCLGPSFKARPQRDSEGFFSRGIAGGGGHVRGRTRQWEVFTHGMTKVAGARLRRIKCWALGRSLTLLVKPSAGIGVFRSGLVTGRACWPCLSRTGLALAGRGSDRTAGGAGLWLAVVRACWPCLSRLGLLLPVGEVIAPLAVRGRACLLAVLVADGACSCRSGRWSHRWRCRAGPLRAGVLAGLPYRQGGTGLWLACWPCLSRLGLLLWWWVLFFALFLLFGLLIRALFCGLFTGVFGGRPPTPPTRLNRGGSGLRKEEGQNGRKGRRGKGFRRFGRVLISSCPRGVHGAGHRAEPANIRVSEGRSREFRVMTRQRGAHHST